MSGSRLLYASRASAIVSFTISARKGRNFSLNNPDRFNFARLESIPEDRQTRKRTRERARAHLGQLVGGTVGDLGAGERSLLLEFLQLRLELLQLRPKFRPPFLPDLVQLDRVCRTTTEASHPQETSKNGRNDALAMPRLTHGDGSGCSVRGKAEAAAERGGGCARRQLTAVGGGGGLPPLLMNEQEN